jgi:NAD(P)-dependent dehydrogenase (short-subunit alcohol dehydrogenase family)
MSYKNIFSLTGKTALVVGAASGIGRASSLGLADFGAHVIVADQNLEGLSSVVQEIEASGGTAEAREVNLNDAASIKTLLGSFEGSSCKLCSCVYR